MDLDKLAGVYNIKEGQNYLMVIKVETLRDAGEIRGLDEAVEFINKKLKTNIIALAISSENDFRLVNADDMSIEQVLLDMGMKKAPEVKDEDD